MNKIDKISLITHIVFSSGGIKGLCYLGILRYLYIENMVDNIKYIAGTSIGAYFSLLLALRIPLEYIENELSEIVKIIQTGETIQIEKKDFVKIFNTLGFKKLDFLFEPIIKFLKEKYDICDITFIEIAKKLGVNIYISSVNINTGLEKIFSAEDTPNVSVLDATKASMSIPIIFEPICIDNELYVDGALLNEIPIHVFDNVNKDNILACIILLSPKDEVENFPKNTNFNLMNYVMRCTKILIHNSLNKLTNKYKNCDAHYVLKIKDLPYDRALKFQFTEEYIKLMINQQDVDNLILKGFIDISNYMNKRFNIKE